jgi:peptidoglycan/xylan/chitin deacetylase (PgdA/CDA1 family)
MYHRLGRVRRGSLVKGHYVRTHQFSNHLKLIHALKRTPITLAQLSDGFSGEVALPSKPIVITFDDGYQSFFEIGLPQLALRGYPATVFLVTGLVGLNNAWDLRMGDVEERLMDRRTILECRAQGVEFGSHTVTHAHLPQLDLAEAAAEIQTSKLDLESWLGGPVNFFCYPYGAETPSIRELVRNGGYLGATTVKTGVNGPRTDPFGWGRINVRSTTSLFRLAFKLWRTTQVL